MCEFVTSITLKNSVGAAVFRTVVKPDELGLWINESPRNGDSNSTKLSGMFECKWGQEM